MARNLRIASVVVDLVANSARYIAGLRDANRDTQRYTKSMQRSFSDLSRNIAGMAAGYLGFSAAINQFNKSLANAKEIEILSALAGQSVEQFQAAAYATNQYGISAEKLGDISKDVADRLGDFIATGGGEFKDFFELIAPQVGLTAKELEHLSGPDVLLRVKKAMDDANVPMKQQIFYLESIANDSSKLIPLLENNGSAYHRLAQEAQDANVIMSQADISALRESEIVISRVSKQISTSFAKGVAGAAEQIDWLGGFVANRMEDMGYWLDSFAEKPRELGNIQASLNDTRKSIQDLKAELPKYKEFGGGGLGALWSSLLGDNTGRAGVEAEIARLEQLEKELMIKYGDLSSPKKRSDYEAQPTVKTGGTDTTTKKAKEAADRIIKENQRILDSLSKSLLSREALIKKAYTDEVNQIQALALTQKQIDTTKYQDLAALQTDYLKLAEEKRDEALENLQIKADEEAEATATAIGTATAKLGELIGAEVDVMANVAENFAHSFSGELATMVMTGKADFASLAESIINNILRMAIQMKIVQPLMQSMGILPTPAATTPAPGLATGGPVGRGSTYLVGEAGPELFTASNSGNITPNNQLGGTTTVNIFTQPGETAETKTRQGEQGDIIEVFMKQVDSRMNEQISRGQGLARTLEGRYSLSRKSY